MLTPSPFGNKPPALYHTLPCILPPPNTRLGKQISYIPGPSAPPKITVMQERRRGVSGH